MEAEVPEVAELESLPLYKPLVLALDVVEEFLENLVQS